MNNVQKLADVKDADLLAVCARAMGFNISRVKHMRRSVHKPLVLALGVSKDENINNYWNPLSNSTDAFDMGVALGVLMNYNRVTGLACATLSNTSFSVSAQSTQNNPHAALRRAIVMTVYLHNQGIDVIDASA